MATKKVVRKAKTTARKAAKTGAAEVEKAVKAIEKKAVVVGKKANAMAKKNPWALAGITAGLGLAVGMLASQKKKAPAKKKKR